MWPSLLIQNFQQESGALTGLLGEATQGGDAGRALAEKDSAETAGDRQTDAFGLSGAGELGLLVGIDEDAEGSLGLEFADLGLQVGDLLLQACQLLPEVAVVEVAQHGVGFAVEALARDVTKLSLLGDVAVVTEENDGGTGKALRGSYDAHGVSNCGDTVGGTSASLQLLALLLSSPETRFQKAAREGLSGSGQLSAPVH